MMWSVICGFLWLYVWQQPDPSVVAFYETSVYWFCISSFVEILVQPVAVVGQILLFVEVKVSFLGITEIEAVKGKSLDTSYSTAYMIQTPTTSSA